MENEIAIFISEETALDLARTAFVSAATAWIVEQTN
jgi:hypothetical protein